MKLEEVIQRRVQEDPHGLLVQCRDAVLSNSEAVRLLAGLKSRLGDLRGRRAVILLPESVEAYLLYLLWFMEGGVLVPVSVQLVGDRLRHVCEKAAAEVVLTNAQYHKTHAAALAGYRCLLVGLTANPPGFDLRLESAEGPAPQPFFPANPGAQDSSVRQIIFTSGSTGVPKGVCLGERSILSAAGMMVQFVPVTPRTRTMVTVPLYDYYGMIQIFGHLLGGGAYAFGFQTGLVEHFLRSLHDLECTDLALVPFTLKKLLQAKPAAKARGFSRLQRLTSSSDMLTEDLLADLFATNPEVTLINIYGLTEAGRACYRKISRDTPVSRSIGRPSPGVEIRVDMEGGGPGELVIVGPNLMLGYLTGVVDGEVQFSACHEMRTGDLGYLNPEGELVLVGRRDHVFNLMGMKVHPSEIEMLALAFPGVVDARAELRQAESGEKYVHLDLVPGPGEFSDSSLLEHLRQRLPRAFVPRTVALVGSLGRTELGSKLLRKK